MATLGELNPPIGSIVRWDGNLYKVANATNRGYTEGVIAERIDAPSRFISSTTGPVFLVDVGKVPVPDVKSPKNQIKTAIRKVIVSANYGPVRVDTDQDGDNNVWINIDDNLDAERLREVIETLSNICDILEENEKNKEDDSYENWR